MKALIILFIIGVLILAKVSLEFFSDAGKDDCEDKDWS